MEASGPNGHQNTTGVLFSDHPSVMENRSSLNMNPEPNMSAKMPLTLKELTNELNSLEPVLSDQQYTGVEDEMNNLLPLLQQCAAGAGASAEGELKLVGAYRLRVA